MLEDRVLDKNIPVPLYFQLKTLILEEIENGSYKSGDKIPTENELSEIFNISRTAVRQAITELVHEGRLYRIKSKGTFVSMPKVSQNIMSRFYSYDDTVLQSNRKIERVELKKQLIDMPQSMIDLGAGKEGDKVIFSHRKRLVDDVPVVHTEAYIVYKKFPELMDIDLISIRIEDYMNSKPETRVSRMVRIVEAVPATKEDINVLDVEPGSAMQKLTTIRYNDKDEVLDASHAYYRGDMNRIELEILNPEDELP